MLEPVLQVVFTLSTTAHAIRAEEICHAAGLPGRLVPTPVAISASCGLCWMAPPQARAELETALACLPPEGVFLLEV